MKPGSAGTCRAHGRPCRPRARPCATTQRSSSPGWARSWGCRPCPCCERSWPRRTTRTWWSGRSWASCASTRRALAAPGPAPAPRHRPRRGPAGSRSAGTGARASWIRVRIYEKGAAKPEGLDQPAPGPGGARLQEPARRRASGSCGEGYDAENFWERLMEMRPARDPEHRGGRRRTHPDLARVRRGRCGFTEEANHVDGDSVQSPSTGWLLALGASGCGPGADPRRTTSAVVKRGVQIGAATKPPRSVAASGAGTVRAGSRPCGSRCGWSRRAPRGPR